ncbi:alpha/beta fold hydrolase [Ideonella sp. DXS29W]|uniref:Alpha/beta fold hydrolase n=1 Tax=Ideonella lacteola TaxID=2984193 RepID=A0ABU9BN51_9BURK
MIEPIRAALLGIAVVATSTQAAPSAAEFFRPPAISSAVLSPSGKYAAVTQISPDIGRQVLAVVDLGARTLKGNIVAAYPNGDVRDVLWVNDDRLVYTVADLQTSFFNQHGRGLYSIERRGGENPLKLVKRSWGEDGGTVNLSPEIARVRPRDLSLDPNHRVLSTLGDGSPNIVVQRFNWSQDDVLLGTSLLKLNTETGRSEPIGAGAPPHAMEWLVDSSGTPRLVESEDEGVTRFHWRNAAGAWTQIREMPTYGAASVKGTWIDALAVGKDDKLYVTTSDDRNGDERVLAVADMRQAGAEPKIILATQGYDFTGSLIRGAGDAIVGIRYLTDAKGTYWFDPALKAIQEQVDKALPTTNNLIDCGRCDSPDNVLVEAYSDRQPTVYMIFRVKAGQVEMLAPSRPGLKAADMAERGFERIPTRDGLSMPVHVTKPQGTKGPLPMVVLVHGGPYVRGGEWEWDADSQFLASRGYLVIEPEFRGSRGYGSTWYRAGWKQWGLAMQDDIADATRWAIDKGLADGKRVCIAGGSYGGYATLMGLVRYPDLYRCGVEYFGVTDIELMYTSSWSDLSPTFRQYGMPVLIGDRAKDAEQLARTSPLKQHSKITQPLLMAHGRQDSRVPIEHGTKLRDALREHNSQVDWVVYAEEAHGWTSANNKIDFWTRVEKFLDKSLKPAP